ncbi:lysozyme inhibitor LprI family protein [Sphingomonas sp.]|uniref:lysozyme inhibitor LprI family protein n=1 Tax=Sphingomonas sp. TaxID=28214 RepID=UPI003B39FE83
MIDRAVAALFACLLAIAPAFAAPADPTAAALQRCLDDPAHGATAGQSACIGRATQSYDRRLNAAYRTLLRLLPAPAAAQLRTAQRQWLVFRNADVAARGALYETRQGTMYVPMQGQADMQLVRDRALQLEGDLRVFRIDG